MLAAVENTCTGVTHVSCGSAAKSACKTTIDVITSIENGAMVPRITDEQREAQDELERAILRHRRAFLTSQHEDHVTEVLSEWVFIGAMVSYDDDGDQVVAYHVALADNNMPYHRIKGLSQHLIDMTNHDYFDKNG